MATTIKQFKGTDETIYQEIAKYAMSATVVRAFKGYPILTSKDHVWFLAFEDGILVAFSAIKVSKSGTAVLINDYTLPKFRKKGLHLKLIKKRITFAKKQKITALTADCTACCLKQYKKAKFKVTKEFKDWTQVELTL